MIERIGREERAVWGGERYSEGEDRKGDRRSKRSGKRKEKEEEEGGKEGRRKRIKEKRKGGADREGGRGKGGWIVWEGRRGELGKKVLD